MCWNAEPPRAPSIGWSVIDDIHSRNAPSGLWLNHTGPTRRPAMTTCGTSIMSKPLPAPPIRSAARSTRHCGCRRVHRSNTSRTMKLVPIDVPAATPKAGAAEALSVGQHLPEQLRRRCERNTVGPRSLAGLARIGEVGNGLGRRATIKHDGLHDRSSRYRLEKRCAVDPRLSAARQPPRPVRAGAAAPAAAPARCAPARARCAGSGPRRRR